LPQDESVNTVATAIRILAALIHLRFMFNLRYLFVFQDFPAPSIYHTLPTPSMIFGRDDPTRSALWLSKSCQHLSKLCPTSQIQASDVERFFPLPRIFSSDDRRKFFHSVPVSKYYKDFYQKRLTNRREMAIII
jgi:hypothetical protein